MTANATFFETINKGKKAMRPSVATATNFVPPAPGAAGATGKNRFDQAHADAFRDLDGPINDCTIMARIAAQMMMDADNGENLLYR